MILRPLQPPTVAALFVATGGAYFGVDGVDPWDESRDARKYYGPHPVVAHPPCSAWCQLSGIIEKRWGHKRGEDGGCFASAMDSVRRWGGVLEHPAESHAWRAFKLPRPIPGRWLEYIDRDGPWTVEAAVCEVAQGAYGHRARKRTWLYTVGVSLLPSLNWDRPKPTATVGKARNHGGGDLPRLHQKEAKATPLAFRDVLIDLARRSVGDTKQRVVNS